MPRPDPQLLATILGRTLCRWGVFDVCRNGYAPDEGDRETVRRAFLASAIGEAEKLSAAFGVKIVVEVDRYDSAPINGQPAETLYYRLERL